MPTILDFTTKSKIKLLLIIAVTVLGFSSLYFTQTIIKKIQDREKEIANLYANSLTYLANEDNISADFTFIFENVIRRIDFPLLITDSNNIPIVESSGAGFRNIEVDSTFTNSELKAYLTQKVEELAKQNEPVIVFYPKNVVWRKIYFGTSDVVTLLKYFPYAQILFGIIFLIIAYASFNYFRKSEESNIWVGLSKETAHQLGTPISSILGWNELLKMNFNEPEKVQDISEEIDNDLNRLKKIANRFSKIGSKPELVRINLNEKLAEIKRYFDRRFPQMGKNISLTIKGDKNIEVKINSDLFEWVIENLIKNARDAIDASNGEIGISFTSLQSSILIEVSDNGKGIDHKAKKEIFKPGFSTKKRGWGLGLTLSNRIINQYHGGKLFLKESNSNGTTFSILLPK